jgi:hypothetical protein
MSARLEVAAVVLAGIDRTLLRGRFLDRPRAGEPVDPLVVSGWVNPSVGAAVAVEVARDGEVVARSALDPGNERERDDAFRMEVERAGIGNSRTLVVHAVLDDGTLVPFGELRLCQATSDRAPAEHRPGLVARLRRALS